MAGLIFLWQQAVVPPPPPPDKTVKSYFLEGAGKSYGLDDPSRTYDVDPARTYDP